MLVVLTEPLLPLVRAKVLTHNDLRTIHFLIAHGGTAPYSLLPLASRLGPGDPMAPVVLRRHAEFVADTIVAGIEAKVAKRGALNRNAI